VPLRLPAFLSYLLLLIASPAWAAEIDLYTSAVRLVRDRYLFPETLTAESMLRGAADGLADEVEWLMIEAEGNRITARHGEDPPLGVVEVGGLDDLPRAMGELEALVTGAGYELEPELQLDVEILKGAISTLDRPSVVLAGRRLESFNERLKGTLSGIGARIGKEDGEIVVRSTFLGGPADQGGLLANDIILRIDAISTLGMAVTDATDRIRGPADTTVQLQVRRGERIVEISLQRAEVKIPNLEYEVLDSGVGYISISHFSEQTVDNLRRALAGLASLGALERGLVLDLRGNTGGSMIQAARSADQFLSDGRLVRTVGRDGAPVSKLIRQMDADDEGTEPPVPLVVLTDDRTASGSEILAGDLALLDRAVLLGQRSYGKGTVQKIYNLRQDVRLKLTVAEYLLADDISVAGMGLDPDIRTGQIVFDRNGVRYEDAQREGVLFVDERLGWGTEEDLATRDDPLVELAQRVVLQSRGPHRDDILAAARRVAKLVQREEDARLVETYRRGGIDWSPALQEGPEPSVDVRLETDGPPRAGEPVSVRALVKNLGPEPLHRVRVVLVSENRTWNGVALPVGYLPAGGQGEGRRVVKLSANQPARTDDVALLVEADGRPSPAPVRELLRIRGRPAPQVAVQAALQAVELDKTPEGGSAWRARLNIRNLGKDVLHAVRVRFDFPADEGIELADLEGFVPSVAPGEEQLADLDLFTLPAFEGQELPLILRIDAEHFGRIAHWEFPLSLDGTPTNHQAPTAELKAASTVDTGKQARINLRAQDDGPIDHAVIYVNGDKHKYIDGSGRRLDASITMEPQPGSNRITAFVEDMEGHRRRVRAFVLGISPDEDPAVAEEAQD